MRRILQYGLGISLIIVGIAGLFLPFLQGVLMIVAGIFVLKADEAKGIWSGFKDAKERLKKDS